MTDTDTFVGFNTCKNPSKWILLFLVYIQECDPKGNPLSSITIG